VASPRPARLPLVLWAFLGLKGRISRSIYWLCCAALISVNSALIGQLFGGEEASYHRLATTLAPFVLAVTVLSNLAVAVKRLHDIGYSGFFALALFVPLVNVAFTIWAGILPGTQGPNRFGAAPDTPSA
jgi:uncharacterized membrane protein YhaH (DUF805 family)